MNDLGRLNSIKRLLVGVTAGPWLASVEGRDHFSGSDIILVADPLHDGIEPTGHTASEMDLVVAIRNAFALIVESKELSPKDSVLRKLRDLARSVDGAPWSFLLPDQVAMSGKRSMKLTGASQIDCEFIVAARNFLAEP